MAFRSMAMPLSRSARAALGFQVLATSAGRRRPILRQVHVARKSTVAAAVRTTTTQVRTASTQASADTKAAAHAHSTRAEALKPLVSAAVERGLLPPVTAFCPAADFYDLDALDERLAELTGAFHESFFEHCLAVKANPTRAILARAVAAGVGCECASLGEVEHSLSLGAKNIIFDSPCKSYDELRMVLLERPNVYMNLDNEQEIADVDRIVRENPNLDMTGRVGLRINPVTGGGTIASVSTATRGSKFGLPLDAETRPRLLEIYKNHRWLQGVHIHVGSQGISLGMLQKGVITIMNFVHEIEELCGDGAIKVVDVGGGMPTSYDGQDEAFTFKELRDMYEEASPRLFSGHYRVMTEFGRCIVTKPGVTVSRVAVVKGAPWHPDRPIAVMHVGSNQFVREAYLGDQWRHRFTGLSPEGGLHKNDVEGQELKAFDVAGPLCFQGDYLIKDTPLPAELQVGDILAMHDTGGYTLAMYSKYNSRQAGPVYGYRRDASSPDGFKFNVMKSRETYEETLAFWGPAEPPSV